MAADNVAHLELRTTPKARPEHGMTKASYVEAVLAGVAEYHARSRRSPGRASGRRTAEAAAALGVSLAGGCASG